MIERLNSANTQVPGYMRLQEYQQINTVVHIGIGQHAHTLKTTHVLSRAALLLSQASHISQASHTMTASKRSHRRTERFSLLVRGRVLPFHSELREGLLQILCASLAHLAPGQQ